jgi:phytoene dehydrogenase-like protein
VPSMLDAVVVGAGPNGLTAAVELARRGMSVALFEARDTVGGGARTEELTLPGFRHDPCSAAHPLGVNSPAFKAMPLAKYGLEWLHPELPMAHPFPDGTAAVLARSVARTAASFGPHDAGVYRRLMAPFLGKWDTLARDFMSLPLTQLPRDPVTLARFGIAGLPPYTWLMRRFRDDRAKALLAGLVAHVIAPLDGPATSGVGMMFALAAHAGGWPVARGGSQAISDALAGYLADLGGVVHTGFEVKRLDDLPPARAYVFDTSPWALARIAGLGRYYERFRPGAAVFKIDYALDGPVPWLDEHCRRAGTVHVGGTLAEVRAAERETAGGHHPDRPFVLVAQASVVDPTRAPAGMHTLWAYCHVPSGSTVDMTDAIERQIERFAPGFRDLVRMRRTTDSTALEAYNPSYIGGDIAGGAHDGLQLLARPFVGRPYRTPNDSLFLCSSATPPGAGVHGMCGHHAADAALRTVLR